MIQDILLELAKGFGKLFLHPLFYFSFIFSVCIGLWRVKRERKDFDISVYDMYHELRMLLPAGLVAGVIISACTLALGVEVSWFSCALLATTTLLLSFFRARFLSPAWIFGGAAILYYVAKAAGMGLPNADSTVSEPLVFVSLSVLVGLLLIGEGALIYRNAWRDTSPRLVQSPRGLTVGAHYSQRTWLIPVFLLLPADHIRSSFDWWPFFSIGAQSFTLFFFPFLIGFERTMTASIPERALKETGRKVIWLGVFTLLLAFVSHWVPVISYAALIFAFAGRLAISYFDHNRQKSQPHFFTPSTKGVLILGVLPFTPAHKMGLKSGEIIRKTNGVEVNSEKEFYEALQRNRAFCKLEVYDVNGQVRFAQSSLYEGEHHELGLIFIDEERHINGSAVS
ncbi:PDZ domain-containing protein [Bacillus sp. FSL W8-0102]|uniref:PDZ domain-containing protein n=1 Tax=Bacillus sp. FSL W8-0102 TaxID=2978205 RepID=UPI0030F9CA87